MTRGYRSGQAGAVLLTGLLLVFSICCPEAGFAGEKGEPGPGEPEAAVTLKTETYGAVQLSMVNFDARGVPGGSARALGLNLRGGVRLSEIVSLEAGVNWFALPEVPLPIPLTWMTKEDGFYLNLGAGLRFNLVGHHSHRTVPWVSVWRVGHVIVSDYSVGGGGMSYGLGLEGTTERGKKWQVSITQHRFTGDLEITEGNYTFEYGDTDIRALELNIAVSMK